MRLSQALFNNFQNDWRAHISSALFALALAVAFLQPNLDGRVLPFVWLGVGGGLYFARKSWPLGKLATLAIGAIVLSTWVAIPLSFLTHRNPASTIVLAILTTPLVAHLATEHGHLVLKYLAPLWLIQAGYVLWQGIIMHYARTPGLTVNPNAGSAFLLLGAIYFISTKHRWLAIPLICAIPFSGSRWVAVTAALVLPVVLTMSFAPHLRIRAIAAQAAAGGLAVIIVVLSQWSTIASAYRLPGSHQPTGVAALAAQDSINRLSLPSVADSPWEAFMPMGFIDSHLHSVPIRMAVETGLPSAVAWAAVSIAMVAIRPRLSPYTWMLVAVAFLSVMYYHTWVGPLGGLWWLLIGIRARTSKAVPAAEILPQSSAFPPPASAKLSA